MRILLVSPYFPPQHAVASLRAHGFAAAWARAGEHVTVLTTAKREDQGGLDLPCAGFEIESIPFPVPRLLERLRREDSAPRAGAVRTGVTKPFLDLLRLIRTRTGIYASLRMPDLTDRWVAPALAWCRRQTPWDVVVSSSGPYTAHLVALALRREGMARRWVADFRDLWTENHMAEGLFPFTLRERSLERQCLAAADLLVTVSHGLAGQLRGATGGAVEVVHNGYDEAAWRSLPPERVLPRDDRINLVYTGTLYPAGQDAEPLLAAMALLRERGSDAADRIRLVVAGRRDEVWTERAEDHGVAGMVERRGLLDRDAALRMQRDADALVSIAWRTPGKGVLSGKIFEYLRASAPILVIGGGPHDPIGDLVRRAGRGVDLGRDVAAIARALIALPGPVCEPAPEPNHDLIRGFERGAQAAHLLELIRTMTDRASTGTDFTTEGHGGPRR